MSQKIKSTLVLGLGKVGNLVGTLLHNSGFEVTGMDAVNRDLSFNTIVGDVTNKADLTKLVGDFDAVVSCLPYNFNIEVAKVCAELNTHYFDLTEDVPTTNAIIEMSKGANCLMAPQCGLAPGFIGIVGSSLAKTFDSLRSIELRVGALPQHPRGKMGYAFNWSAEGVVNEYLNDCEVIHNGERKMVPPMEGLETILIDGLKLEAFTTSGGLGTMCETYAGKVDTLNYKTMRYPGHCNLMRFFFEELHMKDRREEAGEILVHAKPPVNEDFVLVHAAVEGEKHGKLTREEFVRCYEPERIGDSMYRAISWTTAASLCAVIEMVSNGSLPDQGFLKQEDIPLDAFFETKNGAYYASYEEEKVMSYAA